MSFVRRLFAPETARLDEYRERCVELTVLLRGRDAALLKEISRNRKREDLLTNQIIELGGGRRLPLREPEEVKVDVEPQGLSAADESTLRARAHEVLEQQHPGEEITQSMIENAYQSMVPKAEYWLKD